MELQWETRPPSIVHRPREWESSINGHVNTSGSSSSSMPLSGPSLRRRSAMSPPPMGPPPSQPIPRLPSPPQQPLYEDDYESSSHCGTSDDHSFASSNEAGNSLKVFQRPVGSARLAAVAAFSQARHGLAPASSSAFPAGSSRHLSDSPPRSLLPPARQSSTSSQYLQPVPPNPPENQLPTQARPSPRRALTRALELAREAVRLDSTNNDPYGAIKAYGQSVALLNEVMERVMQGEDSTEHGHRRRNGRRRSIVAQEEEVRRLKSIHDTYADRMNILSLIYSIPPIPPSPTTDFARSTDSTRASSPTSTSPTSETSGLPSSMEDFEVGSAEGDTLSSNPPQPQLRYSPPNGKLGEPNTPTFSRTRSQEYMSESSQPSRIPTTQTTRPLPSGPSRPRAPSTLPSQPPVPAASPPLTPTIIEPQTVTSPRNRSLLVPELKRPRGNSTSHKRTSSASKLSSLQEEGQPTTQTRQPDDDHSLHVNSIDRNRDSHPLPPLPSPSPTSDSNFALTPRVAVSHPPSGRTSPNHVTQPQPKSAFNMRSDSVTPNYPLINDSITMGTIHQRRNKSSNTPSETLSDHSPGGTQSLRGASSLPASALSSLGLGRSRASSQPARPGILSQPSLPDTFSRPTLMHNNSSAAVVQTARPSFRKTSSSSRVGHSGILSPPPSFAVSILVPPAPVLPGQLPTTPLSPLPPLPPSDPLRKPYHLMTLLRHTMTSKSGGYITRRLHVPFEVWSQGGAKLNNLPEKVRVVEVLCDALIEVQNGSIDFCGPMGAASGMGLGIGTVGRKEGELWVSKLEEFSAVCDSVVGDFGKKLGVGEGFVVKKSTGMTSWGGKFARKIDKLTNGKNLDSPASYVQGLTKLFLLAQLLDDHTKALCSQPIAPTYQALPGDLRTALDSKFRRSSEFFATVVLTFVIRDLSQLVDKYAKKCEKWLAE